jgi:hypothetical protein
MSLSPKDKPLVWLGGEVKPPPLPTTARIEAGFCSASFKLASGSRCLTHARCAIATRCHELRIVDETRTRRVIYRIDDDAIIIADVFNKTPDRAQQAEAEAV